MTTLPETLQAVIAEMRAFAATVRAKEGDADQALTIEGYADAIESATTPQPAGQAAVTEERKKHDGPCWRNSHADCGC